MKQKALYLLLFLIIPIALFSSVGAYAVSNPVGQPTKEVKPKIEERDLDRYRPLYQKEDDWNPFGDEEISQQVNNVAYFFFDTSKLVVRVTDSAITNLYDLDVIDKFSDKVSGFIDDIYQNLLDNIVMTLFIVVAFNVFIIFSVQGNAREALKRAFLIFCLVGFGIGVLGNASWIMQGTNNVGKSFSNVIMNSTSSINGDVDYVHEMSGLNKIRNQYFDMTIYNTYLMMNYDTVNVDDIKKENKKRIDDILDQKMNKKGEDKVNELIKDEVKDYDNTAMKQSNVMSKLAIAVIGLVMTLFFSVIFISISFAKLIFSTFALILFLFLVFSWLISFIPNMELSIFKSFAKTLGYIILSACMTFLFVLVGFCIDLANTFIAPESTESYFLNAIFVIAILIVLYKKRQNIIDFVSRGNVSLSASAIGSNAIRKRQESWNKMRNEQSQDKSSKRKNQQLPPTKNVDNDRSNKRNQQRSSSNQTSHTNQQQPKRKRQQSTMNTEQQQAKSPNRQSQQSNEHSKTTYSSVENQNPQKHNQQQEQTRQTHATEHIERRPQKQSQNQQPHRDRQVPKEIERSEQRSQNRSTQYSYDNDVQKRRVQNVQNYQRCNSQRSYNEVYRNSQTSNESRERFERQKDVNKNGK